MAAFPPNLVQLWGPSGEVTPEQRTAIMTEAGVVGVHSFFHQLDDDHSVTLDLTLSERAEVWDHYVNHRALSFNFTDQRTGTTKLVRWAAIPTFTAQEGGTFLGECRFVEVQA